MKRTTEKKSTKTVKPRMSERASQFLNSISETRCFRGKGNILMNFSICINGMIWISGFTLVKGNYGNFVSFPQKNIGDGEYIPTSWMDSSFEIDEKVAIYFALLDMAMEDFKELK